jgi:hypothetical protein
VWGWCGMRALDCGIAVVNPAVVLLVDKRKAIVVFRAGRWKKRSMSSDLNGATVSG